MENTTAFARGTIQLSKEAFAAVQDLSKIVKLNDDQIQIRFEKDQKKNWITVFSEVSASEKTSVDIEALKAVSSVLLGIYDVSKKVDPKFEISGLRLDQKVGGASGPWKHPEFLAIQKTSHLHEDLTKKSPRFQGILASILNVSENRAVNVSENRAGLAVASFLVERGASIAESKSILNQMNGIQAEVQRIVRGQKVDILILTGGCGATTNDVTPEALDLLWTKRIRGIGELMRAERAKHSTLSYLSRCEGGFIDNCLVISVPGDEDMALEDMHALEEVLQQLLQNKKRK